jgi:hypothetical protein
MLDLSTIGVDGAAWERNSKRQPGHYPRCQVCNLPVKDDTKAKYVWVHHGGGFIVTQEEGEALNKTSEANADCGGQPVGPECARKHKAVLAPYLDPCIS